MAKLYFMEWLRFHLDNKSYRGCKWIDRNEQTFIISWPTAAIKIMCDADTTRDLLGVMYGWWTHKYGNTRIHDHPGDIKGNFRGCLYTKTIKGEIRRVIELKKKTETATWRAYQFTGTKMTPGKGKKSQKKRNKVPVYDYTESETQGTSSFEPDEHYAESVIKDQLNEIKMKARNWEIEVSAYSKGNIGITSYNYNYAAESFGQNKLLVYFKGSYYENEVLNITATRVPNFASLPISMFPVELNRAMDYDTWNMSIADHFCPGFLLEVDPATFDVYITRLSTCRLFYGSTIAMTPDKSEGTWIKLEAPGLVSPDTLHSSKNEVRQKVFSYSMFLHRTELYRKMLCAQQEGHLNEPPVKPIDPKVYISVGSVPSPMNGISSCDYYFIIHHKPAQQQYNSSIDPYGNTEGRFLISEEMVYENAATMKRYRQYSQGFYYSIPGPSNQPEPTLNSSNNVMPSEIVPPEIMGPPPVPPPLYHGPADEELFGEVEDLELFSYPEYDYGEVSTIM